MGRLYPSAVVTDRSVTRVQPDDDGRIYLAIDHRPRSVPQLPGLVILAQEGLPPQEDDTPLPDGLFLASDGRAIIENLLPRRSTGERIRRTMTEVELGNWLSRIARPERLDRARTTAARIARELERPDLAARAEELLDAASGQRALESPSAEPARPPAVAYRSMPSGFRPSKLSPSGFSTTTSGGSRVRGAPRSGPSSKSYFSNFIEGTEWTVEEARRIVFGQETPVARPQDAHDVRSAFQLINDPTWATAVPRDADELIELLLGRHAILMKSRPDKLPAAGRPRTIVSAAPLVVWPRGGGNTAGRLSADCRS